MSVLDEIKDIFNLYLTDPDGEGDWKETVLNLMAIADSDESPFSPDARFGFFYMGNVVFYMVCRKCADKKAYDWLDLFAKAWLEGTKLPEFPRYCWVNEDISQKDWMIIDLEKKLKSESH
jgi:hypothetical protein